MGASRIYKAFSPYTHVAATELDYAQSADVVYTTHLDYPVYRATRTAHTAWTYTPVTFAPTVPNPVAPTAVANSPNTTGFISTTYRYKITAVGGRQEQESRASPLVQVTNDLSLSGNTNVLTLPAMPTGVSRYVIYKEQAGGYGYIGGTDGLTFTDGNPQIQPVLSDTPPLASSLFLTINSYPSSVTFHNQRLMLAGSRLLPNAIWGSQPSDTENMDVSRPAKPSDALSFALVAEKVNSVHQMVSMTDLLAITANAVFSVSGGQKGDPLTPSAINPTRETGRGGSRLNPIVLDSIVFYTPAKGNSVRTLGFAFEIDGYQSNNVALYSPHFFKGFSIIDWAYIEEPYSAIFAVRNDGVMLCFTWEAEQKVWGWTRIDTDGKVLACASITEAGFDRLYVLVERVINGVTRRFHERLALPHTTDIAMAVHLDCSITKTYAVASNIVDGLWHLEGATVSAYYDGFVEHGFVVTSGKITLPNGYLTTIATVGLRYSGTIETLPLILDGRAGSEHTNVQNVAHLVIRAVDTRGVKAGITGADLEALIERTGGESGLPDVGQRDYLVTPAGTWKNSTTLTIQQDEPLPAHITGLFIEPRVSKR